MLGADKQRTMQRRGQHVRRVRTEETLKLNHNVSIVVNESLEADLVVEVLRTAIFTSEQQQ